MRIAVVQLTVRPEQRTIAFQRALHAVEVAAGKDPSPDLVLLPAFRDVPAFLVGAPAVTEKNPGQSTAAFGLKARQWGVFVSFGFAEGNRGPRFIASALLDRDGDAIASHRQRVLESVPEAIFTAGSETALGDVLVGRVALLTGDDVLDEDAWKSAANAGAAIVISSACWAQLPGGATIDSNVVRQKLCELARRFDMPCAVADVVLPPNGASVPWPGVSTIVSREGDIVAAAEHDKEALLIQTVELPQREGLET